MTFECPRCAYKTNRRQHFDRHVFGRKERCVPCVSESDFSEMFNSYNQQRKDVLEERENSKSTCLKPHVCNFCSHAFNSRGARSYHTRKCHKDELQKPTEPEQKNTQQPINVNNNNNITIDGNNNTVSPVINIYLNAFGKETSDYVSSEEKNRMIAAGFEGLKKFIDDLFFNKEHPENHTVKLRSMKNKQAMVYIPPDWECESLQEVITKMIDKAVVELFKANNAKVATETTESVRAANEITGQRPKHKTEIARRVTAKLQQRRDVESAL